MRVSPAGRAFIEHEEGCELTAYQDVVGVWTIGVGHTGREVKHDMTITREQADAILSDDLQKFERCVNAECRIPPTQSQFDALVSLAFNIGIAALASSSVLRRYNAGDLAAAGAAFMLWDKVTVQGNKVVSSGLHARRERERALFLT